MERLRQLCRDNPGLLQPDPEWQYEKKRTAQEIVPRIWLGPHAAGLDEDFLRREGITHCLIVRAPEEERICRPKFPDLLTYEVLDIRDNAFEGLIAHLKPVKAAFDAILKNPESKILVHGMVGMSRSAAVLVGYVMQNWEFAFQDAHDYVLCRRGCVGLNEGFRRQLQEFDAMLKTERGFRDQPPAVPVCAPKRRYEDMDQHDRS